MKYLFCLGVIACCLASNPASATEPSSLNPNLEPLRPFLARTWKGAFKNSTPEKPVVDVMRWERALNGQAIRILHSVNDGAYGGEMILTWDSELHSIVYHYFTTAGFMTKGTISFKENKLISSETVHGNANGVTHVRGTSELLPDGTFRVQTDHLKDGVWEFGREVNYVEDPNAQVRFN